METEKRVPYTLRLPAGLIERVRAVASREDRTATNIIVRALSQHLSELESKKSGKPKAEK